MDCYKIPAPCKHTTTDNPIPPRFLALTDCYKIPALCKTQTCECVCASSISHPLPEPGLEPLLGGVEIVVHHLHQNTVSVVFIFYYPADGEGLGFKKMQNIYRIGCAYLYTLVYLY